MKHIASLIFLLFLSGCTGFGTTKIETVATDKKQLVFVDANRRAIIAAGDMACAEPSPDVAANLKDILAVTASLKTPGISNTEASANANHESTLAIAQLINRSQGLQNFRDALYRACEARLNGFITNKEFIMLYNNAISSSTSLIALEIIANKGLEKDSGLTDTKLREMLNFLQVMFAQPF